MKFCCEKNLLQEGVSMVSKAVSGKSALPILEGIRLEAGTEETISLCGFDLQMAILTQVEAQVLETGVCVLDAKVLSDIIRKMPNEPIDVEVDEENHCIIRCGPTVFEIMAMTAEEYPALPELEDQKAFPVEQRVLKSMIGGTIFAVSENQAKPIHTGCLFEKDESELRVIAVDGYRLSVRREPLDKPGPGEQKFVVPGFALKELERLLSEEEEHTVIVRQGSRHIQFDLGRATLLTRLLEGAFLEYRQAIPQNQEYTIVCDSADLTRCFDRVSLLITERLKTPVRLTLDGHVMQLLCVTSIGRSYDEYEFQGEFDQPMEIGFNNRFVLDALRACPDGPVQLKFSSSLNPMVISPMEGDSFTYMILPVRLRNE